MNSPIELFIGNVPNACESMSELVQLLSPQELKRVHAFRFKHDSKRYLFAHAMLRKLIGEMIETPPELLKISSDSYGKPSLENKRNIKFSISTTKDLVAIALSRYNEVGVDVEKKTGINNIDAMVDKFMGKQERLAFKTQDPTNKLNFFYRCWVRKESVAKAWGTGIDNAFRDLNVMEGTGVDKNTNKILYKKNGKNAWILMDIELDNGYFGAICSEGKSIQIKMHSLDSIP